MNLGTKKSLNDIIKYPVGYLTKNPDGGQKSTKPWDENITRILE